VFRQNKFFFPVLIALLVIVMLCAIAFGAVKILPSEMFSSIQHFFAGEKPANIYEGCFYPIAIAKSFIMCHYGGHISRKRCIDAGIISQSNC
jgi:hypothetical protein